MAATHHSTHLAACLAGCAPPLLAALLLADVRHQLGVARGAGRSDGLHAAAAHEALYDDTHLRVCVRVRRVEEGLQRGVRQLAMGQPTPSAGRQASLKVVA
jgi:hypothetical protein